MTSRAKSGIISIEHVFLRIPTPAEVDAWETARQAAYEAELPRLQRRANGGPVPTIDEFPFEYDGPDNTFSSHARRFLVDGAEMRTFLLEVPAGDYVIYGVSVGGWALVKTAPNGVSKLIVTVEPTMPVTLFVLV